MLSGVIGTAVADRLNAAKTAVDNRVGAVKTAVVDRVGDVKTAVADRVGAVKTAVVDRLNGVLKDANTEVFMELLKLLKIEIVDIFDTMPKVVANVENIIKEIDVFFETNTIKLGDFLQKRNNLIGVIKGLKAEMNDLKGVDTTHQDLKIKYDKQIGFCKQLFNEYKEELDIILKYHSMISPIIMQLLRIIRENKGNTERMNTLTELRKRLERYNEKLLGYLLPQCIVKLFGGGSYKKTNKKKNILGRERCIYKKSGDRKEYLKYKGDLITVKEYKIIMRTVANHR